MAPIATASGPWAFWRSLGSPRFVCAPMVDQSELAFRSLTRQLGVGLAYTPMLHARLMVEHEAYRAHTFDPDPAGRDGPLFAQLAGHDPAVLLQAGRLVQVWGAFLGARQPLPYPRRTARFAPCRTAQTL
jgi:tRNA-dihydrouridine synthase